MAIESAQNFVRVLAPTTIAASSETVTAFFGFGEVRLEDLMENNRVG